MFRPCLYLIVPCYNEEKVLPITATSFLDEIMLLKENGITIDKIIEDIKEIIDIK